MKTIGKLVKIGFIVCMILATVRLGYNALFGGMSIEMLNFVPYPLLRQCEIIHEDLDLGFGNSWQLIACGFDEKTASKIADVIAGDGWNELSESRDCYIEIVEECCFSPENWSEYYNSEYTMIKDMIDGKLVDTSNCYWAYTGDYVDGDRNGRHELILCDMDERVLVEIKIVH